MSGNPSKLQSKASAKMTAAPHPLWLLLRRKVPSSVDENVCPVALLVDDSSELAVIAIPMRRRFPGEPLKSAERCILGTHFNDLVAHDHMNAHTWITTAETGSAGFVARKNQSPPSDVRCGISMSSFPEYMTIPT